jgi:hypothetical protein
MLKAMQAIFKYAAEIAPSSSKVASRVALPKNTR